MFYGVTDIWTFVVGTFFIILLPGPNSMYVLSTAARHGVATGYRAASGVFVGDTVLMVLAAAGVASMLKSHPMLFTVIKYAGAVYLAWMGTRMIIGAIRSWRRGGDDGAALPADEAVAERAAPRPFRRALVLCLLNPKAILFFAAFFIQFVDPGYAKPALSFLILGAIVQLFSFTYLTALILGGTFLARQFRSRRRLSACVTTGVGALFVSFAAKLGTATTG